MFLEISVKDVSIRLGTDATDTLGRRVLMLTGSMKEAIGSAHAIFALTSSANSKTRGSIYRLEGGDLAISAIVVVDDKQMDSAIHVVSRTREVHGSISAWLDVESSCMSLDFDGDVTLDEVGEFEIKSHDLVLNFSISE